MYKYELVFKAKIIFLTQNFILSLVILNWLFQRDQVQFTYWEMFLRYEFCDSCSDCILFLIKIKCECYSVGFYLPSIMGNNIIFHLQEL